jgi:hypothetical protein
VALLLSGRKGFGKQRGASGRKGDLEHPGMRGKPSPCPQMSRYLPFGKHVVAASSGRKGVREGAATEP